MIVSEAPGRGGYKQLKDGWLEETWYSEVGNSIWMISAESHALQAD